MTLAIKRMQNIGWLALVFTIAILLYPLSLNVAAVHSDLVRIDRKIMETKREISFLDAELTTRANVAQLDEWNQLLYGYEPPTAEQFLEGEQALANLNGNSPMVKPVMVSVSSDGVTPAGEVGRVDAAASNFDPKDDAELTQKVAIKGVGAATISAKGKPAPSKPKPAVATLSNQGPTTRTEQLAKIDEKLLSDRTLKEIQQRAKEERKRR
jgi:hypothetical protein